MARASKDDPNNEALGRGEKVEGSVTGLTDAPQDRATAATSGTEGRADTEGTRAPEAGPVDTTITPEANAGRAVDAPTAIGLTQVADHSAYVAAAQQGYWGETPANNTAVPGMPAHGDGDLRVGKNEAAALTLGPEVLNIGEEADRVVAVIPPSNPKGDTEPAPPLDPSNPEQYGNGPATEDRP
jgi:hypothetical protein